MVGVKPKFVRVSCSRLRVLSAPARTKDQIIDDSLEVELLTCGQMQQQVRWEKSQRRKSIKVREKVEQSQNTAFFRGLMVWEGRNVASLKWKVQSQLVT